MNNMQRLVRAFHKASRSHIEARPHIVPADVAALRQRLHDEETKELNQAIDDQDIVQIAKEGCDLMYVTVGTFVSHGLPLQPLFNEVHRSNMTKLPFTLRPDGKVVKGPNYEPPRLVPIIMKGGIS